MRAYFDGSGSKSNASEFLVLTGAVATHSVWDGFEKSWRQVLADRHLPAPYLHMKEVIALKDGFDESLGWTAELAGKVVTDCLMYAQTLDKLNFRVFTCTLDMKAYHEAVSKGAHLPNKLNLLVRYCADKVVSWFFQKYCDRPGQHLSVYFDRGERFKGRFETRAIKKKKLSRLVNGWHLIEKIEAVDMKDTPGLQLADFMAWVQNRRLVFAKENTTGKYAYMAKIAEGVLPFTRLNIDGVVFERMAATREIAPYLYRDQDIEE